MTILSMILGGSAIFSLVFMPFLARLAHRAQLLDQPDGQRKIHARAVPLVGGLALFLSISLTIAAGLTFSPWLRSVYIEEHFSLAGLFGAALVICLVGVVDDRFTLRGRHKLIGQLLAVGILIASGVVVDSVDLFGWRLNLGPFAIPFTAFWLLGAINSLNLIDGMDGMLGTVAGAVAMTVALLACWSGHWFTAALALALAGSIIGFLFYNLPPAKVFLGDCGSMLIGLLLGFTAFQSALKGPATVMILIPVSLLTLPILDCSAAVARRALTGRSLYATDRGHLHHCLQRSGLSHRRVLLFVAMLCLVTGIGALASVALQSQILAACSAIAVPGILIVTRLFGQAELILLKKRIAALLMQLRYAGRTDRTQEMVVRLQGSVDWQEVWQTLTETATQLNLLSVRLDVNVPSLHEAFHARWDRHFTLPEHAQIWKAEIPLTLRGKAAGRLEMTGLQDRDPVSEKIAILSKIAFDIEQSVESLAEANRPVADPQPVSAETRAPQLV